MGGKGHIHGGGRQGPTLARHDLGPRLELGEEDVRVLIAYLRAMPPVRRASSPARPPAPDDCTVYTFWVARATVAGCR